MNTAPPKQPDSPRHASEPHGRNRSSGSATVSPTVIGVAVALVVVLLAAVAFVLTSGDDGDVAGAEGANSAAGEATDDSTNAEGSSTSGDAAGAEQAPAAGVPGVPGVAPSIGEFLPVVPVGDPLPAYDSGAPDLAVGMQAPAVNGQAFDGTPLTVGGPTDGPSLYVFLAHWCPHCNDEIPELNELRDAGTLPPELNVIGVASGSTAEAPNYPPSQWAADKDWTWPMLADDELGTTIAFFGGTSFPFAVVVDADGEVLARKAGTAPADAILGWIEAALA